LPSWGLSNAASTLVGQNLGAGKPDRAEKSVWAAGKANVILLGIISLIFMAFPGFFIGLFIDDHEVIQQGSHALRIISIGFIFYGLGMVLHNALNGAGDTVSPTWFNLICFWGLEVPLAYVFALLVGWEENGVYISIVIAESILCLITLWWFRKGKWKLKKV
jgi:Na+-driven multidrug efflux pump